MNGSHDSEGNREHQLDEALADYFRRVDRGECVDHEQFLAAFPHLAPDLQQLLEAAQLVEHIAGEVEGPEDSDRGDESANASNDTLAQDPHWLAETAAFDQAVAAHAARAQDASSPKLVFGDYEIIARIGRGGMGVVYKARQKGLDRLVAVKMIRAADAASDTDVERFLAEAHAAGKLGHPNIVQVHQVGVVKGQYFYSMEYVDGADLAHLSRSQTIAPKRMARYVRDVAQAIQFAHEHSIVHRDLKPANVIVDVENDRPLVTDFGLAKDVSQDQGLTASGAFVGTPSYMSPEQASGRLSEVGAASDIYSLGAILYELLTGRPPFRAPTTVQTILDVIHTEPVAPHAINPHVERQLEAVCLKCLRKNPRERYATAQELSDDLDRFINDQPVLAHPKGMRLRCWHWLRDVPLVAAIVGRRVTRPTRSHLCAQWMAIAVTAMLLALVTFVLRDTGGERPFPQQVRIAAGQPGWKYDQFADALANVLRDELPVPVSVLETDGAVENRDLILAAKSEVALLQAGTISSGNLAVVAPLYEEYVYFVARVDSDIEGVEDFANKNVVVGFERSGMRLAAERVLEKLQIDVNPVHADFSQLQQTTDWEAAIVTTGPENRILRSLLLDDQFALISLKPAEVAILTGPEFRPRTLPAGCFRKAQDSQSAVPAGAIQAMTTTTYLVVHKLASSRLVERLLHALYHHQPWADFPYLVPLEEAVQWPALPLHPAARRFYDAAASRP